MKRRAELVFNLALAFWTKRRILFVLGVWAIDRLFSMFTFPVILIPALATLSLFDYKADKFPELQDKPVRQKLVLLAPVALALPFALLLIEVAIGFTIWLLSCVSLTVQDAISHLKDFPWAPDAVGKIFIVSFMDVVSGFAAYLSAFASKFAAYFVLFWICLPIAATEQRVDHAMLRAYLYGFALSLIPYAIVSGINGAIHEWELSQSPVTVTIATYRTPHSSVKVSSTYPSPVHPYVLDALTNLVSLLVWGVTAILLLRLLQRISSSRLKSILP